MRTDSDSDFKIRERALQQELVFAIRKFLFCARRPFREIHKSITDSLEMLSNEARHHYEIWEEDGED